ncbi:STAS/SEC14 domain-containing protein [Frigidibacter sp. ROC022]|uniref:STAS/SEC14 domain-containing protein n=1 Tax=Frigidibacter sp. ROC022 TaxID=2971796 RepID=UPI00215B5777|nr:STAS/SEC14 domain-containing protein [Frigidibacter sp. ROC022]MCR8725373.1 STAS/SEC14 domain-containing protein [Frigidibacter sp. ROC022]
MIEVETKDGIVVATAKGEVTADDYEKTLVPGIEAAIAAHGPVRMLYWFGPEFTGFSAGGAWADMRLGMRHLRDIERVAVVTDNHVMGATVQAFAAVLPMAVRVFGDADIAAANAWLVADDPAKG